MVSKGFKTLQGRLVVLLLLPVFVIIFSGGVASFLFTRDMVLAQWNESALLKLQRAAHYIEMRLMKPIFVVETFLQLSSESKRPISLLNIRNHLNNVEGIVDVNYRSLEPLGGQAKLKTSEMIRHGMMRFRHSRIGRIPIFPVIPLALDYACLPSASGSSNALLYKMIAA
ncbi:MAG: hypothetical protein HUK40_05390 [Desulfobacter sp.]|nr:hypothetical protein [Desulfobacter sp.]